jgi:sensor histidine kinase YesM
MFFFFIVFRYFVDQVLDKWLFGITNYDATVTFRYFFYDNLSFSFITILAGLFLKFMDDWLINDRIKQDLEKQNLRLELDFLKSQLNPHFLFNTLNNIQSYIYQDEKNKSIEMIGQLSDFMRFTLYECEEEFISLDKEIRMLAHYVELERVRCEDRIKISFDAKGNFNLYQIPPLLFMPFIENAFKHSTKVHSKESWIKINININEQDNWLELYVGNSFENSTSIKKIGGIGLQNSQKRLQHYFLHKHRLNINYHDSVFELNLNLKPVMLKNISC